MRYVLIAIAVGVIIALAATFWPRKGGHAIVSDVATPTGGAGGTGGTSSVGAGVVVIIEVPDGTTFIEHRVEGSGGPGSANSGPGTGQGGSAQPRETLSGPGR